MSITLEETVEEMVDSLEQVSEEYVVTLEGINRNNYEEEIDNRFDISGEVRCERFTDIAIDYSFQYGGLETESFRDAQAEAIKKACDIIEKRYS